MDNIKISKKLVSVMGECNHIAKNGVNGYHNYTYATAEDVLLKVNDALVKNKIASIVIPEIKEMTDVKNLKGNTEHLVTISVRIHLIDSDSGECVDLYGIGSGQDAGDKAVMKAQTAAIKYAYMLSLCIATEDDPESDIKTDISVSGEKAKNKANASSVKQNVKKQHLSASIVCESCGTELSEKVLEYSKSYYGKPLCMNCQKKAQRAA